MNNIYNLTNKFTKYVKFLSSEFNIQVEFEKPGLIRKENTIYLPTLNSMSNNELDILWGILLMESGFVKFSQIKEDETLLELKSHNHLNMIKILETINIEQKLISQYAGAPEMINLIHERTSTDPTLKNKFYPEIDTNPLVGLTYWLSQKLINTPDTDISKSLKTLIENKNTLQSINRFIKNNSIEINKIINRNFINKKTSTNDIVQLSNNFYQLYYKNKTDNSIKIDYAKQLEDKKKQDLLIEENLKILEKHQQELDKIKENEKKLKKQLLEKQNLINKELEPLKNELNFNKTQKELIEEYQKLQNNENQLNNINENYQQTISKNLNNQSLSNEKNNLINLQNNKKQLNQLNKQVNKLNNEKNKLENSINKLNSKKQTDEIIEKIKNNQSLLDNVNNELQQNQQPINDLENTIKSNPFNNLNDEEIINKIKENKKNQADLNKTQEQNEKIQKLNKTIQESLKNIENLEEQLKTLDKPNNSNQNNQPQPGDKSNSDSSNKNSINQSGESSNSGNSEQQSNSSNEDGMSKSGEGSNPSNSEQQSNSSNEDGMTQSGESSNSDNSEQQSNSSNEDGMTQSGESSNSDNSEQQSNSSNEDGMTQSGESSNSDNSEQQSNSSNEDGMSKPGEGSNSSSSNQSANSSNEDGMTQSGKSSNSSSSNQSANSSNEDGMTQSAEGSNPANSEQQSNSSNENGMSQSGKSSNSSSSNQSANSSNEDGMSQSGEGSNSSSSNQSANSFNEDGMEQSTSNSAGYAEGNSFNGTDNVSIMQRQAQSSFNQSMNFNDFKSIDLTNIGNYLGELEKTNYELESKIKIIETPISDLKNELLKNNFNGKKESINKELFILNKELKKSGINLMNDDFTEIQGWDKANEVQKEFDESHSIKTSKITVNGLEHQISNNLLESCKEKLSNLQEINVAELFKDLIKTNPLEDMAKNNESHILSDNNAYDFGGSVRKHIPSTTQFDIVEKKNTVLDNDKFIKFNNIKKELAPEINKIKKIFLNKFKFTKKPLYKGGKEEGDLDSRNLYRLATGVDNNFYEISNNKFINKIAATIIIDMSGSLNKDYTNEGLKIIQSALLLSEGFTEAHIPHEIISFGAELSLEMIESKFSDFYNRRTHRLKTVVLKDFNDKSNIGLSNFELLPIDNCDGESINIAYKRLKKRIEKNKVVFVISDGKPFLNDADPNILDEDVRSVVRTITNDKNHIFSIGFNDGPEALYANRYQKINEWNDLHNMIKSIEFNGKIADVKNKNKI